MKRRKGHQVEYQRRREAMEEKQNSRENPEESGSEITQNMM